MAQCPSLGTCACAQYQGWRLWKEIGSSGRVFCNFKQWLCMHHGLRDLAALYFENSTRRTLVVAVWMVIPRDECPTPFMRPFRCFYQEVRMNYAPSIKEMRVWKKILRQRGTRAAPARWDSITQKSCFSPFWVAEALSSDLIHWINRKTRTIILSQLAYNLSEQLCALWAVTTDPEIVSASPCRRFRNKINSTGFNHTECTTVNNEGPPVGRLTNKRHGAVVVLLSIKWSEGTAGGEVQNCALPSPVSAIVS